MNIFDQYDHLENRLTHALAVTLKRSRVFRDSFVRAFAPRGVRFGKTCRVELQLAGEREEIGDEPTGIPDLAIIDEDGRALIIEAKVGDSLKAS